MATSYQVSSSLLNICCIQSTQQLHLVLKDSFKFYILVIRVMNDALARFRKVESVDHGEDLLVYIIIYCIFIAKGLVLDVCFFCQEFFSEML